MRERPAGGESAVAPIFMREKGRSAFFAVSVLLFAASATATCLWCASMSAMGGMSMPGEWTMSMAWMRMPGQSWLEAGGVFLAMWLVMMAAMMLPSLAPMLWRTRLAIGWTNSRYPGLAMTAAGAGYFLIWTGVAFALFPLAAFLAAAAMESEWLARAVPVLGALAVLTAGVLQFTPWKERHLACCRAKSGPTDLFSYGSAFRHGLRLGLHCLCCSAGPTAILALLGIMDMGLMTAITAAITIERLAPSNWHAARGIGFLMVSAGLAMLARGAFS